METSKKRKQTPEWDGFIASFRQWENEYVLAFSVHDKNEEILHRQQKA